MIEWSILLGKPFAQQPLMGWVGDLDYVFWEGYVALVLNQRESQVYSAQLQNPFDTSPSKKRTGFCCPEVEKKTEN